MIHLTILVSFLVFHSELALAEMRRDECVHLFFLFVCLFKEFKLERVVEKNLLLHFVKMTQNRKSMLVISGENIFFLSRFID